MTAAALQVSGNLDEFARSVNVKSFRVPPRLRRVLAPSEQFSKLCAKLCTKVVEPLLWGETREECFAAVRAGWSLYLDTMGALRLVIETHGLVAALEGVSLSDPKDDLRQAARRLAGAAGEDELLFDSATYERALRLVGKVPDTPPSDAERDLKLADEFNVHASLYELATVALLVAASDRFKPTSAGIDAAFEMARGSALRAYAAVREAIALRTPTRPTEEYELAPFDEEDAFLAGC